MNEPLIIGTDGKLYSRIRYEQKQRGRYLSKLYDELNNQKLVAGRFYMNQSDFNDIMKWGKE